MGVRSRIVALLIAALPAAVASAQVQPCASAPVYQPCEISITLDDAAGAAHPNPYATVELRAEFRSPKGGATKVLPAFWDGGNRFRLRFSPDFEGDWAFRLISNVPSLDKKIFNFRATAPTTPGFIHVFNTRYFRYSAPDTGHYWMGDTMYPLATIPWATFTALVDKRAEQKFNHARGLVLGWEQSARSVFAVPDLPKIEHFQELDRRVAYLNSKGFTVDLVLAGGNNELADLLPKRADRERYVKHVVGRYAGYNVTWQGVLEFETYERGRELLKEVMGYVKQWDPYDHPRSTHTVATSSPLVEDGWMTYITHQSADESLAAIDYEMHLMPVVNAEIGHENSGAGATREDHVSSDEFRKRLWRTAIRGVYPTFSNTGTAGLPGIELDSRRADSPGAAAMTHLYNFFSQTRYFDLQPYYGVDGGVALAMQVTPYRDEKPIGIEYIVYLEQPGPVEIVVPKDGYDVSWFNPIDGTWIDEKKKYKGDRFQAAGPPNSAHDWVLYVRREGKKESFNKSFYLEARGVRPKEVESKTSEVPYEIQFPDLEALTAGESYDFNATLTKSSTAAKRMLWLWKGEVAGSGFASRIIGTKQFGKFRIPTDLARRYPATLSIRLLGLDGAGRLYETFRAYRLEKGSEP